MDEPLLHISDSVTERIPGLIIIAGVLEVEALQTAHVSRYLTASWKKLGNTVREHGIKTHPHIEMWRAALRSAGVPLKKCPPSIEAIAKRTTKSSSPFSILASSGKKLFASIFEQYGFFLTKIIVKLRLITKLVKYVKINILKF